MARGGLSPEVPPLKTGSERGSDSLWILVLERGFLWALDSGTPCP